MCQRDCVVHIVLSIIMWKLHSIRILVFIVTKLSDYLYGRSGRSYSRSFRWTKLKETAWKLTAVAFLVAVLIWWNEQPVLGH